MSTKSEWLRGLWGRALRNRHHKDGSNNRQRADVGQQWRHSQGETLNIQRHQLIYNCREVRRITWSLDVTEGKIGKGSNIGRKDVEMISHGISMLDNKVRQGKTHRENQVWNHSLIKNLWRNTVGIGRKNHRILRGKANLVKKVYYEATWKVQASALSKRLYCFEWDVHTGPETIQAWWGNGNAQEIVWDKAT